MAATAGCSPTGSRRGARCRSRLGELELASGQLPETDYCNKSSRTIHPPTGILGTTTATTTSHHHHLQPIPKIPRRLTRPQLRNGWNTLRSSPQASTQGQAEWRWEGLPALQGRDPRQGALLPTLSLPLASKGLGVAMGGPAPHSHGSRSVQVGSRSLGILR